jgi:uncharacterized protein with HEPN domain
MSYFEIRTVKDRKNLIYVSRKYNMYMSPKNKKNLNHLLKILEYITKIISISKKMKTTSDIGDLRDELGLHQLLINIRYNVRKLSECFKNAHPHILWQEIIKYCGSQNKEYLGRAEYSYFRSVAEDFELLKEEIEKIIRKCIKNKIFDVEKINKIYNIRKYDFYLDILR